MSRLPAPYAETCDPVAQHFDVIDAALLLTFACIMFVVGALVGAWLCL